MEAQSKCKSNRNRNSGALDPGVLAARALYVNQVTRQDPRWADWNESEPDNSLAAPEVTGLLGFSVMVGQLPI